MTRLDPKRPAASGLGGAPSNEGEAPVRPGDARAADEAQASRTELSIPLAPLTRPPHLDGERTAVIAPAPRTALPETLGDELAAIVARLRAPGELSEPELSALRSQLLLLDRGQLQAVRKELDRGLPAWRKARVRDRGVLAGPATVDKVMELVGGPGRLGRLPLAKKEELRLVRESNVDALLARAALRLVNGNDGLHRALNVGDARHPEGLVLALDGKRADSIDQRYLLLDVVSSMFKVGYAEREIRDIAREAAAAAIVPDGASVEVKTAHVFQAVLDEGRTRIAKRARAFEALPAPADLAPTVKAAVGDRLSQVRWIEARVASETPEWSSDAPALYKDDLRALLERPSATEVLEALDARFERVMNYAIDAKLRAEGLQPLPTMKVERLPAERIHHRPDVAHQALPAAHPVRARLAELHERLERGEKSAVGVAYATQTFPEEVLDKVARGEVRVVAFDGSRENGVRYIRNRWGVTDDGLRMSCRLMGLQGVYGSYPRTLVTLDDGQQFLLLTGYGSARQLNNAGALLLYETDDGARVPLDHVELATDGTDFTETVRGDLRDAIAADWGDKPGTPDRIPTRLLILQNPTHLDHLFGDDLRWAKVPEGTLVPFFVGYRTHPDGHEERIVIPKVGGGGVYGDTAGQFITAFFTSGMNNLVPDVIFNGTAGGFAGTHGKPGFEGDNIGLPEVEPGGLFMPTREVEQYGDGRGPQPIPSMLGPDPETWPVAIRTAVSRSGVHLTGRHVAIAAPAIETFPLVHGLVRDGHASIDVEAGAIMDAARKLGKTCTVVYTHSDDPRASEDDPNASLGMVGPFLEGSRYHEPLFTFVKALWDLSDERFRAAP